MKIVKGIIWLFIRCTILVSWFHRSLGDTSTATIVISNIGIAYVAIMSVLSIIFSVAAAVSDEFVEVLFKDRMPVFTGMNAMCDVLSVVAVAISHPLIAVLYGLFEIFSWSFYFVLLKKYEEENL